MARSRFIRPEFFTDDKVGELPFGARLLYQSCWCQADLRGVFEPVPKILRAVTFPYDEGVTSAQVADWLTLIESHGMIVRFEADGRPWACIPNWTKHQTFTTSEQKIGTKRPAPQRAPPRKDPVSDSSLTQGQTQVASPSPSPSLTPSPTPAPAPAPGACVPDLSRAPMDLPPRLRESWQEIVIDHGSEVAQRAIVASRRLHGGAWPSPSQLLQHFRHACEQGALALPPEQWPDWRKTAKRERLGTASTASTTTLDPETEARIRRQEATDTHVR